MEPAATLTIDLDAIADNYRLLAARAQPARCSAVVKADAYGLGAARVAPALAAAGCRTFFVALLAEGVTLRAILPDPGIEIGVLNGLAPGEEAIFREHRLFPVLNDLTQIELWADFCRTAGPQPAAVHIDTGMSRLGLPSDELARLIAEPERLEGIALAYWLSHLACAEVQDEPKNREQQQAFAAALSRLPPAPGCLANSSGIFLGPEWHFDVVRPGAALYGVAPVEGAANPMRQVVRLQARVLQIRTIDAPQTVGYGASHRASGPTRVATVGVGYADGFLRSISGRGTAYVGNVAVSVLGRISMDLTTVDVTSIPRIAPGDLIDLIGPNNDINRLADAAGTIAYEILTSLGPRYGRIYREGASA